MPTKKDIKAKCAQASESALSEALSNLQEAIWMIENRQSFDPEKLEHYVTQALLHVGEARGHRNASYDLTEE